MSLFWRLMRPLAEVPADHPEQHSASPACGAQPRSGLTIARHFTRRLARRHFVD
ncbi:MAG: hypothetical protein JNM54_09440 [Candidatus Accumulibacter sp.]|uniref:hypothetical protein n=1 Tax=unclassified Candidatus Accumulibacter TaxID=2619054 RepID=UPI001A641D28|nr:MULTISPECIES: hypothetical protein [unclassified Candidatus Accumulibacter]MBL8368122.1 hypothetical protein [Accumulibacter sp.]MBN8514631.1 hypothetical protein [Accumulibacter sp.]MBO3704087.1 hypothetical protein [Accumulibacter sp.]